MKVKSYFKFSNFSSNEEKINTFKINGKKMYKKGILTMPPNRVTIGRDGDDFIYNNMTVLLESKAYRVPRILNKICN